MKLFKLFSLLLAVAIVVHGYAQEKKMAIVSGKVLDARTKDPLNEAVVTISSSAFTGQKFAITDSTGNYRINNLPTGVYCISFEMEGYRKFTQDSIKLQDGMSLGISFQMVKDRKEKPNKKTTTSTETKLVFTKDTISANETRSN